MTQPASVRLVTETALATERAVVESRNNHTGTQSADTLTDGTTSKVYTATEQTKLAGIASGATANSSDVNLRARSTHTGTQLSTTISDFTEATQDAVAALLAAGTGVTLSYNDAGNLLTVTSTGGGGGLDAEAVRDAIGVALIGVTPIQIAVNDPADTITVSTTATVNASDSALRDRTTHTGTQSADTLTDGTTNKAFLATERTKLTGIATAATANATDAALRDRTTHTGVQAESTITNLVTDLAAKAPLASPTFTGTVSGVTKAMVGLTSVDDTADLSKPVSTLQQAAVDAYAPPIAKLPAGTTLTVIKAAGVWAARPTSRSDVTVIWMGADPSPAIVTTGTAGMRDGVDVRFVTP